MSADGLGRASHQSNGRETRRLDCGPATRPVAFGGVLVLGILKGVLLAAVASILMLLRHAATPHAAFLGRIGNTRRFSDLTRHPDNERIPGVVVFRVESSLLYFNTENVLHAVLDRLDHESAVRPVVCDLPASPYVDLTGARTLARLNAELATRGIALRLADPHATTRHLLRAAGLKAKLAGIDRFTSVADVVERFRTSRARSSHPDAHPAPPLRRADGAATMSSSSSNAVPRHDRASGGDRLPMVLEDSRRDTPAPARSWVTSR